MPPSPDPLEANNRPELSTLQDRCSIASPILLVLATVTFLYLYFLQPEDYAAGVANRIEFLIKFAGLCLVAWLSAILGVIVSLMGLRPRATASRLAWASFLLNCTLCVLGLPLMRFLVLRMYSANI